MNIWFLLDVRLLLLCSSFHKKAEEICPNPATSFENCRKECEFVTCVSCLYFVCRRIGFCCCWGVLCVVKPEKSYEILRNPMHWTSWENSSKHMIFFTMIGFSLFSLSYMFVALMRSLTRSCEILGMSKLFLGMLDFRLFSLLLMFFLRCLQISCQNLRNPKELTRKQMNIRYSRCFIGLLLLVMEISYVVCFLFVLLTVWSNLLEISRNPTESWKNILGTPWDIYTYTCHRKLTCFFVFSFFMCFSYVLGEGHLEGV